jgi:hypothetical protein
MCSVSAEAIRVSRKCEINMCSIGHQIEVGEIIDGFEFECQVLIVVSRWASTEDEVIFRDMF